MAAGRRAGILFQAVRLAVWLIATAMLCHVARAEPVSTELRQKIGQMIVIGFHGGSAADPRFREVVDQLEAGAAGGVLFLDYNVASRDALMEMTAAIRNCRCKQPPLIAIDEEGGRVQRIGKLLPGGRVASAAAMGASRDLDNARRQYAKMARQLRNVGFNLNLAPVVDVDVNPANPIIGRLGRSFSDNPGVVADFARVLIEAHHAVGLLTALKHFPGHGSAVGDSHDGPVDVTRTWIGDVELAPYRKLIGDGGVDIVMIGHLAADQWGGVATLAPATAISKQLRGPLGFRGVVMTDDLEMGAVQTQSRTYAEAITRAVQAGNDILLISNRISKRPLMAVWASDQIASAVERGLVSASAIDASAARIAALKARLSRNGN